MSDAMDLSDESPGLSLKERIKLFSKGAAQSDVVRIAQTGSPAFSPSKRKSLIKRPTNTKGDTAMPLKHRSCPSKRASNPFPPVDRAPAIVVDLMPPAPSVHKPVTRSRTSMHSNELESSGPFISENRSKRKQMIEHELLSLIHKAEEQELGKEMREEGVNALKIAANKFAYRRRYLDSQSNNFVTFPSLKNCLAGSEIYEEAEKHYYDAEDEFPLKYIAALKEIAFMIGGVPDGDEDIEPISEEIENSDDDLFERGEAEFLKMALPPPSKHDNTNAFPASSITSSGNQESLANHAGSDKSRILKLERITTNKLNKNSQAAAAAAPPPPPQQQLLPTPNKLGENSTNTDDPYLSPLATPRRRQSTNSMMSATGNSSYNKSPRILRKKIEKCHTLLRQESTDSKACHKLTLKLEQYEIELQELAYLNKSTRSASSSKNQMKTLEEESQLLEKQIAKVQNMLLKEKDPTMFVKLTAKLEQYQKELYVAKNCRSIAAEPTRRRSFKSTKKMKTEINSDLKVLQRKLKKVDKLMSNFVKKRGQEAFRTSDFKKLLKKRDEYLDALDKAGITYQDSFSSKVRKSNEEHEYNDKQDGTGQLTLLMQNEALRRRSTSFIAPPPLVIGNKIHATSASSIPEGTNEDDAAVASAIKKRKKATGPKKKTEKVCAPRLQELDGKYTPKVFLKTKQDSDIIMGELAKNFIFQKVQQSSLEQMLRAFEPVNTYTSGDVIIKQGDGGDYFYILGKGSVSYEVNGVNVGGTDKPGASFGELALLYQSPRKATVRAKSEKMTVYRVDQVTFRYILQSRSKFLTLWKQTVNKIMAMNRLLGLGAVAEQLKEASDHESEMDHSKKNDASDGNESIGEHSLDLEAVRDDGIDDVDSDHEDQELSMYMSQLSQRRLSIQSTLSGVTVDDFRRRSILGEGQFGEVWLVQPEAEEISSEQFALKIQSKEDMSRAAADYSVAEAIERECKVLSDLCHPFIVDFVHSFEDDDNIYLVMGAIKGEELWNRVHREQKDGEWVSGILESDSKFYAILIADTLHYMHRQQTCYRDMKPENVMIDHTGYPIIVDFGFAKFVPDDKTYTFCGTPQYTAPEIISNQGHGRAVDNWALGVVIYEMISGENPFWYDGISELQLLNDISNSDPEPIKDEEVECSEEGKNIISKLLEKDPSKRLFGNDITSHPWFDSIDLAKARKMALPAPWAPRVDDNGFTP